MNPTRNHTSAFHKIYPLQKYLYMMLQSIESELEEPLSKAQHRVVSDHIENSLVVGYEQGKKRKKA